MGNVVKVCRLFRAIFAAFWPIIVWFIINYFIFKEHYSKYWNDPKHYYLRQIIGRGLCVSRATAAMLNFSCCVLLIPMCRSFNLALHHLLGLISQSALMFWIKNARKFHIMCAISVIIESLVHSVAHIVNASNFSKYFNEEYPALNWAKYSGQPVWEMILTSVVGVTGVCMICILVMMSLTSLKYFREEHYQLFWFFHHSYLLFLVTLLCHPLSGALKEMANSSLKNCSNDVQNLTSDFKGLKNVSTCESKPIFVAMKSETWIWITPPFLFLIIDRLFWSLKRNWNELKVLQVSRLPGSAIHLVLQSPSPYFMCQPGQYILLQCPVISSIEWHPFSVVSFNSSDQPSLSVLIRAKGDWTEEILSRVLVPFAHLHHRTEIYDNSSGKSVTFLVDGPFRSPLEEVLNAPVAFCVAAGIGITPFISIFNYLLSSTIQKTPQRIHVLWILRNPQQLIWCSNLLCDLFDKFWHDNTPDRLVIEVHITKDYNPVDLQEVLSEDCKLLLPRIRKGRPIWGEVFNQIKEMYCGQTVYVFASGPKSLVKEIGSACNKVKNKGISIKYAHETF